MTSIFRQKPTWISCVKRSKINVTHLSKKTKATSESATQPSRSLSSLQRRKSAPIFTRVLPLADLIVTLLLKSFVSLIFSYFYLPSFSIYSWPANISPVHANWVLPSVITRHAPLLLIGYKCVLGHGPTLWSSVSQKSLSAPLNIVVNIWRWSKPFIKVVLKPKCVLVLGQPWTFGPLQMLTTVSKTKTEIKNDATGYFIVF